MEILLNVSIKEEFYRSSVGMVVPDIFVKTFEPLKTSDEPLMAYCEGGVVSESAKAIEILKARKDAAETIAKQLTDFLMDEMKKNDTINGYPVKYLTEE